MMANCFVIMPFRPEFNFLYRTIKSHLEQILPEVTVERGDDKVLTKPILEKIADFIRQADVVIADSTGRNPNVFYELGLAHALEKPVVLITSDAIEEAPTDIRAFEFISYAQLQPDAFLDKLERALHSVVGNPFAEMYAPALDLFRRFCAAKALDLAPSPQGEFEASLTAMYRGGERLPASERSRAEFLVRRLLGAEPQIETLIELKDWLDGIYP